MRASKLYAPTLREVPAEAEIVSHQLMLRTGMLNKVASGIYTYMPLAWRSMKKIMEIIREEMDAAGAQELFMPVLQPAEFWLESGRWNVYGEELVRLKDRHDREFCLGPTHEEVITTQFRQLVRSYRQLPLMVYQIQTKVRDERRPRFGLIRGREFMMKDCYSFDRDEAGLEISYQKMWKAYDNIFSRCGLKFRPVAADNGAIGGNASHEFMALADIGESEVLYCDSCGYAATNEVTALPPEGTGIGETPEAIEKRETPDCKTVDDVAAFLGRASNRVVKSLCYFADGELVLALIRGDRRLNEVKLQNALGCCQLFPADEESIRAAGLVPGFMGPVGAKVRVIADGEVALMVNTVTGANEAGYHLCGVNYGRDYQAEKVADIRIVEGGERCPDCGGTLLSARGIEVGQIFKLQTKYSEKMNAKYIDENGKENYAVMGCYGIGVGRTMAAAIEQGHDEYGIIWPAAIAPYHAVIVPVNNKNEMLMQRAEEVYAALEAAGVETVLDDRAERAGVKFNDADLIGYPLRLTMGPKLVEQGKLEIKIRKTGEVLEIPIEEAAAKVKELLAAL